MSGLTFTVRWSSGASKDPAVGTRGQVWARLGDDFVWGSSAQGFEWTWVDFLEHLARVWPRLLWQPMPLGLPPDAVGSFSGLARDAMARLDPDEVEAVEEELFSFSEAHDLAHGIAGARLPSLWMVPEAGRVAVATEHFVEWLEVTSALTPLERFGSEIAARLEGSAHPRAIAARAAWAERCTSIDDALALYTGWAPEDLATLGRHVPPASRFEVTPVAALARAVRGVMAPAELKAVLDAATSRVTAARRRWSMPQLDDATVGRPFEQGFVLATRVREHLGVGDVRLDPAAMLKTWGVRVVRLSLPGSRQVDAVATWAPGQATIVVNRHGRHARSASGERATLAHELCHLLFDAGRALPLAEALGGRMPRDVEQRARAFVAELLLPRARLAARYDGDALGTVRRAAHRYGVSAELAAWQLRNSGLELASEQRRQLKALVSRPDEF